MNTTELIAKLRDNTGSHINGLYDCQAADAIEQLQADIQRLMDDSLKRVMAASEEELNAALKLDGKDPEDAARLAGQAMKLAVLEADRRRLSAALTHIMAIASYTPMQTELTTAGQMGRIMRVAENALNGKDLYDRPAAQD